MANLNGFNVSILEAYEETSDGYVVMKHGQTFSIRLHNGHKENGKCIPADAEVYVQGKYCGTFRVAAGQTIRLERPLNDSGKFTAYRNDTWEAKQSEIDPDSYDNGLIKVVWKPGLEQPDVVNEVYKYVTEYPRIEWQSDWQADWNYYSPTTTDYNTSTNSTYGASFSSNVTTTKRRCCSAPSSLSGGGVGLSSHSNQSFNEVRPLNYTDHETTIHIRIAFRDANPRPITPVHKVVYDSKVPRPLR